VPHLVFLQPVNGFGGIITVAGGPGYLVVNRSGVAAQRLSADGVAMTDVLTAKDSVEAKIQEMVRRVVDLFDPEQIILFGSHARGEGGPDSDVDLLVVMSVDGSKRDKGLEIRRALHNIRIPKDIIVTTPEEFLWRHEIPGTIERPAAQEGKLLYARP
jgi:predicted nucleotidyltransferase